MYGLVSLVRSMTCPSSLVLTLVTITSATLEQILVIVDSMYGLVTLDTLVLTLSTMVLTTSTIPLSSMYGLVTLGRSIRGSSIPILSTMGLVIVDSMQGLANLVPFE